MILNVDTSFFRNFKHETNATEKGQSF